MNRWQLLALLSLTFCSGCTGSSSTPAGKGATATGAVQPLAEAALTDVVDDRVVGLWIMGRPGQRVDLAELAKFPDVNKLTLQECPWLTDADLKHVSQLPQLETLVLIRTQTSDDGLANLAPLASLSELRLVHTDVVGNGLKHLHDGKLRRLEIHGDKPTHDGLASLDGLATLTELVVRCPSVDLAQLKSVATLSQLESLDVRLCVGLNDSFIASLQPLDGLRSFAFESRGFSDQQLKGLCQLTSLQEVDLRNAAISNAGLDDLATLPALQTLRLSGCDSVTDAGLKKLVPSPALKEMFLTHSGVQGTGLSDLADLKTLQHISIFSGQLSPAGRKAIRELSKSHSELDIFIESQ